MPVPASSTTPPATFCADPLGFGRRRTRVVRVGDVAVGGDHPIRLQSMVVADTLDTAAAAAESLRLAAAGCEIVRLTAPTVEHARNLARVRDALRARGCRVPLVADIHFSPQAALEAALHVEKVRINPGNFADSKRFLDREYTDAEYAAELDRIAERFLPLVERLKALGRALRIGVNHGSLSDRIMNRYGDTPLGMVECALEYLRLAEGAGYRDIILSMKSSNPKVMVQAYRLLAARMDAAGMDYPLHLGVTEAGDGADGRIKSAVGIGTLLEDGLGDTIRVSLTEDSEAELPVARRLAAPYPAPARRGPGLKTAWDPFAWGRRASDEVAVGPIRVGGANPVRVVARVPRGTEPAALLALLETRLKKGGREPEILEWVVESEADLAALRAARAALAPETARLGWLVDFRNGLETRGLDLADALPWDGAGPLLSQKPVLARLPAGTPDLLKAYRTLAARLDAQGLRTPILLQGPALDEPEELLLRTAVVVGGLLVDGIGDAVAGGTGGLEPQLDLLYDVLQGAGSRVTKAEFVSCPSCGRTLFDLQETTERIKRRTAHLKGVKIAIMGCIVNGPGEMADADFGYVGGAPDRINLYVGKDCVRKGVPTAEADQALVDLIKQHGRWTDPK